jgi:2-oxoisovalerate dehydrogenase E2 component (dihydrolipoyl transacylase)
MALYSFRLPDIGEGVAEAEIIKWHVSAGDQIEEDGLLVDVMTDKATVEMTSPVSGRVISINGEIGQMLPVGSLLAELDLEDESVSPVSSIPTPEPPAAQPAQDAEYAPQSAAPEPEEHRLPLASPATRRIARERGVPLQSIRGSGPSGRILLEDLDHYSPDEKSLRPNSLVKRPEITETKITGLRRRIAEKMQEAKRHIPHFSYVEEIDITELEALRTELNAERQADQPKLTRLPFFMRAIVRLVDAFPQVNARYDDAAGVLHSYRAAHIGIATQTEAGLLVPVVRHAEARDIWDCARELARVTATARAGKASSEELSGSTITLTSLGALGGIAATPVINHPEVAIIGPNKLVERPMVRNGQIVIRKMMNLSTSFDHRIIDGYVAARFVQKMKRLLENPALLFVEKEAGDAAAFDPGVQP